MHSAIAGAWLMPRKALLWRGGYDWQQLEREQRAKAGQITWQLGITWIVIGVVGGVGVVLLGRPDRLVGSLIWILIGLILFLGSRSRRRGHR
jgi:hypothetical protein